MAYLEELNVYLFRASLEKGIKTAVSQREMTAFLTWSSMHVWDLVWTSLQATPSKQKQLGLYARLAFY